MSNMVQLWYNRTMKEELIIQNISYHDMENQNNDEKKRRLREIIVEFEEDIKDNYWEFFIRKILRQLCA